MAQKRKLNDAKFPEAKNKASKLEISEATKKAMTKNELMNKYNTLIKEHEDLVKLHEENLQRVKDLEKTIKKIKEEDNNQKVHVDVDVQTDDSETCLECEFPANDIYGKWESTYGWNHPGGTSLQAGCHQIMFTVELLPGSFFDENARVLLRLSNEGERTENM